MRAFDDLCWKMALGLALALGGTGVWSAQAASTPKSADRARNATNAVPQVVSTEIPQSVFVIPSSPKDGRNPFFPRSVVTAPPTVRPAENPLSASAFVLNGITSPPKATAMINNYTFEAGEEREVKLRGGAKALVKCEEIKADSAVILVNGVRRELKLRSGL